MSNIDTNALLAAMLSAARGQLTTQWAVVQPFAESEMQKLVTTALQIQAGQANSTINSAQAKTLLKMQANASQAVLTAVETVGMVAAQDAINAALNVLVSAVNKAIGVAVL